ncbi:MAG: recombinase family protein [Oscillospiraceae bacterium]|nr:recombinase family protein [Oscillospiraceae bacterium]
MVIEKTAAAYIRVSTEEQTELSPDSQLKEIRKYAESKSIKLLEEHIYVDAGISGRSTAKRPEFNKMISIAKMKAKPFDIILLWKFSRFARNREDSIVYKSILRKECGIDVVSISEALGDDKTSVLIEALIEAMDEYYSLNLAGEVKRGLLEKVERGEPVTTPSFGYNIVDSRYIIDEERAKLVRSLFYDYLNGTGLRALAVGMNNMGVLTNRGGKWDRFNIEYILRNPVYIGKIRYNTEHRTRRKYEDKGIIIKQGLHEPIIDEETFNKTQERLAYIKSTFNKGEHHEPRSGNDFILRGLIKCSNCGSPLIQAQKGSLLQCNGYIKGKCTTSHAIKVRIINEEVLKCVEEDIELDGFYISPCVTKKIEEDVSGERIKKLNKKLLRVMEAYENGVYSLARFKDRKERIDDEIKKLEALLIMKKETPVIGASERKDNIKAGLAVFTDPDVSETEKNLMLRHIILKIIFERKNNEISIFYR